MVCLVKHLVNDSQSKVCSWTNVKNIKTNMSFLMLLCPLWNLVIIWEWWPNNIFYCKLLLKWILMIRNVIFMFLKVNCSNISLSYDFLLCYMIFYLATLFSLKLRSLATYQIFKIWHFSIYHFHFKEQIFHRK